MFICVGPNCWGSGETKKLAMRNCAKAGPGMRTLRKHYLVYEGPEDMGVDEFDGSIYTTEPESKGKVKLVEKKGQ